MAALERRVAERWQLVIDNDLHGAYQYLTPGYRGTYSVQDYVSRTRSVINFTDASWQAADCSSDDSCLVDVQVGYRVRMPSAGDVPSINHHQERWIRTGGEWYFLPSQ